MLGKLSGNITLVTANVVALYPSMLHEDGLETLTERLVKSGNLKLLVNDIIKVAALVLKNNIFEFKWKLMQHVLGSAIGTKFASTYACIYMNEVETQFFKTQELQPLVRFQCLYDIFFV